MIRKCIIWILGIVAVLLLVVGGFILFMLTDTGQQWATRIYIDAVREELGTKLNVGSFRVHPISGRLSLHDMELYDKAGVKMLKVDTAEVGIDVMKLFYNEIIIDRIKLAGASSVLYKNNPDSAANYQFVVDALSKKKDKKEKKKKSPFKVYMDIKEASISRTDFKWDILSAPSKGKDTLDVNHIDIRNFHVTLSGSLKNKQFLKGQLKDLGIEERKSGIVLRLDRGSIDMMLKRRVQLTLEGMSGKYRDKRVGFKKLTLEQQDGAFNFKRPMNVQAEELTYFCNNGKPRKNTGRPHRGWFDQGHLNSTVNMDVNVDCISADSTKLYINSFSAYDKDSGLDIKNFSSFVTITKDDIFLTKATISLARTRVKINKVQAKYRLIPADKEKGTKSSVDLQIQDFPLTAKVYLQDIAKPFAPVLSHFTTPLNLDLMVGGTLDRLLFKDIVITTFDKRLRLTAEGDLCDVLKKHDLCLHFSDIHLDARNGIKDIIVNHFAKKTRLKMMRQMRAVGDISFSGRLGIFFKKQTVGGKLFTRFGDVDFDFHINGWTHFLKGWMTSKELKLGEIMNAPGFEVLDAQATYNVNISKKSEVSKASRARGGRLPIGELEATLGGARYKVLKFKDITASINSDGVKAEGAVRCGMKYADIEATLEYVQTDKEQHYSIRPHIRRHEKFSRLLDKYIKESELMRKKKNK